MSLIDFVFSPPVCGRSVTDYWGLDAHKAQLHCPDKVDGDIWVWITGRGNAKLYEPKLSAILHLLLVMWERDIVIFFRILETIW
jgi:hypothetical protein